MKALPIDNISSTVFIYRIIMNIDRKLLGSDISAVEILHLSLLTYAVKTRLNYFNNSSSLYWAASVWKTNNEIELAMVKIIISDLCKTDMVPLVTLWGYRVLTVLGISSYLYLTSQHEAPNLLFPLTLTG